MTTDAQEFWNERYAASEYIYGITPNLFLQEQLEKLQPGSILLPADGEGRNAVYAAKNGWKVTAFDISEEGMKKATKLASKNEVAVDFQVQNAVEFESAEKFDVIAFSYAHFPAEIRKNANQHLLKFLKPGGTVIFEAFAKSQLGRTSGGPKKEAMLYSIPEVKSEFPGLQFNLLREELVELSEGKHHQGEGCVIRFVGVKTGK